MRIGIVNDLSLARETLRRVVEACPGQQVAWFALNGEDAIRLTREQPPDLVLMDMIMPRMDGVEATRRIMSECPCPILIVTSSVSGNISKVYEAMGHGALDAVDTPCLGVGGRIDPSAPILHKIERIARMVGQPRASSRSCITPPMEVGRALPEPPSLIVIGSSTGGPTVLARILSFLPRSLDIPVVIVQHVDEAFVAGLANWLGANSPLPVEMATAGQSPRPGRILLAQTHEHALMMPDRTIRYSPEPSSCHYRPSVDVFFQSVARSWKKPGIGVILTGMGRDGAEGLLCLRRAGWTTIAQSRESCTIWGMPKAAVEVGAAMHTLNPDQIGQHLARACTPRPVSS